MSFIKEIWQAQHWASIIGFILVVIGSLFTFFGTFKTNEKDKKDLADNITRKDKTIDTINRKIEGQSEMMDRLRQQNTELNELLLKATKELSDILMGSESYCIIEMNAQYDNNPDHFWINVMNKTRHPLRDISLRYYDNYNPHPITLEGFASHTIGIGNLRQQSIKPAVIQVTLNRQQGFSWNFFFTSNGPESAHFIRKQFVKGKWITAEQVRVDLKVIYTKIDPDFPEQDAQLLFK